MPIFRQNPFSRAFHPSRAWLIYTLAVVFNYHSLIVAYSNSTYLEKFTSPEIISFLYTIGSIVSAIVFLFISKLLNLIGNVWLAIGLALAEISALILIGLAPSTPVVIAAFVALLAINPLIYLTIDIFSETIIGKNENATGSTRGLTLTLMSLAAVAAPLSLSLIVGDTPANLDLTYFVSAGIFLIFVVLVIIHSRVFIDPPYEKIRILNTIANFWQESDVRFVLLAHLLLQVFFAWMIIYLPLYLATEIGFNWEVIGTILAIGLVAYVVFEYPIGFLADRYFGEKEMMAIGFLILAVSSSWISFMEAAPILSWMVLMFVSRTGASLVEATTESYFFKHTNGSDANIISLFRLTRPLAMILGSLFGALALYYLPFQLIFVVLGLLMIPGIFFTLYLHDTR